jgi:hypothetical protein
VDDPAAAPADAEIAFTVAVIWPGTTGLEERSRFDAAVFAGGAAEAGSTVAGSADGKLSTFDADGIERAATKLSSILEDLTRNPDQYQPPLDSDGNVALLRQLALQGRELFTAMGRYVVEDLAGEDLRSIQVLVSDPNRLVPVEFVYDAPAPTNDAALCPNWRAALADGVCDPANHPEDATGLSNVVCPSGFWRSPRSSSARWWAGGIRSSTCGAGTSRFGPTRTRNGRTCRPSRPPCSAPARRSTW